jgi:hypothetical protein
MRFELMTSSLPRRRSTPELRGQSLEASSAPGSLKNHRTSLKLALNYLERATRFELATLSLEG